MLNVKNPKNIKRILTFWVKQKAVDTTNVGIMENK